MGSWMGAFLHVFACHTPFAVVNEQDGQLDGSMERMRYAAMDLLIRMSRTASRKRIGTVFLITNFDHVLTVCSTPERLFPSFLPRRTALQEDNAKALVTWHSHRCSNRRCKCIGTVFLSTNFYHDLTVCSPPEPLWPLFPNFPVQGCFQSLISTVAQRLPT